MSNNTADRLVAQAKKWNGYLEKKSNASLDNFTANAGYNNFTCFNRDYGTYAGGYWQAQPWCAMYVSMMFVYEFGIEKAKSLLCGALYASCTAGRKLFMNAGQFYKSNPQPGDIIYFYNSSLSELAHTGIVVSVSGGRVYTIEGNTSSSLGVVANGGAVAQKSYALSHNRIAGYGRPKYDVSSATYIRQFQTWLNSALGTALSVKLDVDGEYGKLTNAAAIMLFQQYVGLPVTGKWDNATSLAAGKNALKLGDKGDLVRLMQGMLYCVGYDPQGIDGDFGKNTESALEQFHLSFGWPKTAFCTRSTWIKLLK